MIQAFNMDSKAELIS